MSSWNNKYKTHFPKGISNFEVKPGYYGNASKTELKFVAFIKLLFLFIYFFLGGAQKLKPELAFFNDLVKFQWNWLCIQDKRIDQR